MRSEGWVLQQTHKGLDTGLWVYESLLYKWRFGSSDTFQLKFQLEVSKTKKVKARITKFGELRD